MNSITRFPIIQANNGEKNLKGSVWFSSTICSFFIVDRDAKHENAKSSLTNSRTKRKRKQRESRLKKGKPSTKRLAAEVIVDVFRRMGSCGEFSDDGSTGVLAAGGSVSLSSGQSSLDDDGVVLEAVEIMDSEDDDESDDPLRNFVRKRARTVPAALNGLRTVLPKRARTDPAIPQRNARPLTKDLLSILRPDSLNNTTIQNDFSIMASSSQVTSHTSVLENKEQRYGTVITSKIFDDIEEPIRVENHDSSDEELANAETFGVVNSETIAVEIETVRIFPSQDDLERSAFEQLGSENESSDSSPERRDEAHNELQAEYIKEGIPEASAPLRSNRLRASINVPLSKEKAQTRDPSPSLETHNETKPKDNVSTGTIQKDLKLYERDSIFVEDVDKSLSRAKGETDDVEPVVADSKEQSAMKNTAHEAKRIQTESPAENRPTRRKSTLIGLCANNNPAPYRVGLSRRANVSHLHSYLAKR